MADTVVRDFKEYLDELRIAPGEKGIFEVRVDGDLIYTNEGNGEPPEMEAVIKTLEEETADVDPKRAF